MVNQLEIDFMYGRNQYLLQFVKHRWFSGRIVACHAIGRVGFPVDAHSLNSQQKRESSIN